MPPRATGPPPLARRLDIKSYPRAIHAFALLYFTGSEGFSRSLRLLVRKCGWSLGDQGMYPVVRALNAPDKLWEGLSIRAATEADIFAACGVPFVPPPARELNWHVVRVTPGAEPWRLEFHRPPPPRDAHLLLPPSTPAPAPAAAAGAASDDDGDSQWLDDMDDAFGE